MSGLPKDISNAFHQVEVALGGKPLYAEDVVTADHYQGAQDI